MSPAMRACALAVLLATGCTPPPVEDVPASASCTYAGDFPATGTDFTLELGQLVNGGFQPLDANAPVEVWASPSDKPDPGSSFVMVLAVRATPFATAPAGDQVCGFVDLLDGRGATTGVPFHREGEAWVSGAFYSAAGSDPDAFDGGAPLARSFQVMLPGPSGTLHGEGDMAVLRVNRQGYLSGQ